MNKLKTSKQETVIHALVEGCSIRSTERMTGVHRDTIVRLVGRVGAGCEALMSQTMRNQPGRYSPPHVTSVERSRIMGDSRSQAHFNVVHRTRQSQHADGMPTVHAVDQRLQQTTREHEGCGRSALRALQLRENASHDQVHTGDASWNRGRTLVNKRFAVVGGKSKNMTEETTAKRGLHTADSRI